MPERQGRLSDGGEGFGGKPWPERGCGGRYCAPLVQQSPHVGQPVEMACGEFRGVCPWQDRIEVGGCGTQRVAPAGPEERSGGGLGGDQLRGGTRGVAGRVRGGAK